MYLNYMQTEHRKLIHFIIIVTNTPIFFMPTCSKVISGNFVLVDS